MATLVTNGLILTQHENHYVSVSKNGKSLFRFAFSRELSGEELSELAFWVRSVR